MKKSLIKPFLLDSIMVNNIEKIDSIFFSNLNVKKSCSCDILNLLFIKFKSFLKNLIKKGLAITNKN